MSLVWELQEIEKREALRRVLASSHFHGSDQLKSLLQFVCEREIAGLGDGLSEYTVAIEGLGRPAHYSPFEDGTVRNRIHNLRRRLNQYYEVDHPDDPVRIVLPKGSYCPIFRRQPVAPPAELRLESPAATLSHSRWPTPARTILLVCGLSILAMATGLVVGLRKGPAPLDPVLTAAWGPLLEKNSNPLICIATGDATEIPVESSAKSPFWGDVAGALAVSHRLSEAGLIPEASPDSAVPLPALYKRNLLMFGRPGLSKAIDLYLRDMPFRVTIPDKQYGVVIRNAEPKPGEPSEYDAGAASREANREIAFGLITVMPSWGDANRRTVVFSGTPSPGSQAASEFFSSAKQMATLLRLFRMDGYSDFPPSYQVVVRSRVLGPTALDVQYVTHRIVSKTH